MAIFHSLLAWYKVKCPLPFVNT
uniref:Uncharacterized protein n=1 Tax=Arundo donax TaxID=35708 RepID=A0A0A9HJM8_ARUDO